MTLLTPEEAEDPLGGYGKTISHVVIGLKTSKGTKQLRLDASLFDSIEKEKIQVGDVIYIEKIDAQVDSTVSFDVLLMGNDGDVKIGTPVVEGVKVEGKVVAQVKGEKILIYKYKSKKNYHRRAGHRQAYTKVEITSIG